MLMSYVRMYLIQECLCYNFVNMFMLALKLVYKVVYYFMNVFLLSIVILRMLLLYYILILNVNLKVISKFLSYCVKCLFFLSSYVNHLNLRFTIIN